MCWSTIPTEKRLTKFTASLGERDMPQSRYVQSLSAVCGRVDNDLRAMENTCKMQFFGKWALTLRASSVSSSPKAFQNCENSAVGRKKEMGRK